MVKDSYYVLVNTSFVVNMKREGFIAENAKIWNITEQIEDAVRKIVREVGLESECCKSAISTIDGSKEPQNAFRCAVCGEWISAQNRPNIIPELGIGAEHNGKYYCWNDLPEESAWVRSQPRFGELPPPII